MSDTLLNNIAGVIVTDANYITVYTRTNATLSGKICSLITMENNNH